MLHSHTFSNNIMCVQEPRGRHRALICKRAYTLNALT